LTISYNGWVIRVEDQGMDESVGVPRAEWETWSTSKTKYVKMQKIFGTYVTSWTLTCMERGTVTWANSVVGSLKTFAAGTVAGSLVFNEGDLYSGTYMAFLTSLDWKFQSRDRFYTLHLQEEET